MQIIFRLALITTIVIILINLKFREIPKHPIPNPSSIDIVTYRSSKIPNYFDQMLTRESWPVY